MPEKIVVNPKTGRAVRITWESGPEPNSEHIRQIFEGTPKIQLPEETVTSTQEPEVNPKFTAQERTALMRGMPQPGIVDAQGVKTSAMKMPGFELPEETVIAQRPAGLPNLSPEEARKTFAGVDQYGVGDVTDQDLEARRVSMLQPEQLITDPRINLAALVAQPLLALPEALRRSGGKVLSGGEELSNFLYPSYMQAMNAMRPEGSEVPLATPRLLAPALELASGLMEGAGAIGMAATPFGQALSAATNLASEFPGGKDVVESFMAPAAKLGVGQALSDDPANAENLNSLLDAAVQVAALGVMPKAAHVSGPLPGMPDASTLTKTAPKGPSMLSRIADQAGVTLGPQPIRERIPQPLDRMTEGTTSAGDRAAVKQRLQEKIDKGEMTAEEAADVYYRFMSSKKATLEPYAGPDIPEVRPFPGEDVPADVAAMDARTGAVGGKAAKKALDAALKRFENRPAGAGGDEPVGKALPLSEAGRSTYKKLSAGKDVPEVTSVSPDAVFHLAEYGGYPASILTKPVEGRRAGTTFIPSTNDFGQIHKHLYTRNKMSDAAAEKIVRSDAVVEGRYNEDGTLFAIWGDPKSIDADAVSNLTFDLIQKGKLKKNARVYFSEGRSGGIPVEDAMNGSLKVSWLPGVDSETVKKVVRAAKDAWATGGFTINPRTGEKTDFGEDSYAVSQFGDRQKVFDKKPTQGQMLDYMRANGDLLKLEDHHVGGWESGGKYYVDVVNVLPREEALALGKKENQIAIGRVNKAGEYEELPTGGTGQFPEGYQHPVPAAERLQRFREERMSPEEQAALAEQRRRQVEEPVFSQEFGDQPNQIATAKAAEGYLKEIGLGDKIHEEDVDAQAARIERVLGPDTEAVKREIDDYEVKTGQKGERWYGGWNKSKEILKKHYPEMADPVKAKLYGWMMNIFANGDSPRNEFLNGIAQIDRYRRGEKLTDLVKGTHEFIGNVRADTWSKQLVQLQKLIDMKGEAGAVEWLESKHPVLEVKRMKALLGESKKEIAGSFGSEYGVGQPIEGAYIFGPKLAPYGLNKEGISGPLTLDKWMNVALRIALGDTRISIKNIDDETLAGGNNVSLRAAGAKAVGAIARKLGMTPEDTQALMWVHVIRPFFERHGQNMKGEGYASHADFAKFLDEAGWFDRRARGEGATLAEGGKIVAEREILERPPLPESVTARRQPKGDAFEGSGDTSFEFGKGVEQAPDGTLILGSTTWGNPVESKKVIAKVQSHARRIVGNERFRKWFGKSTITETDQPMPQGYPKLMFHGTDAPVNFEGFRGSDTELGIHFGTRRQAQERLMVKKMGASGEGWGSKVPYPDNGRLIPLFAKLEKPYRFEEDLTIWSPERISDYFYNSDPQMGVAYGKFIDKRYAKRSDMLEMDPGEYVLEDLPAIDDMSLMTDFLKSQGYDGYSYPNGYEVPGGQKLFDDFKSGRFGDPEGRSASHEFYRRVQELKYSSNPNLSYAVLEPSQLKSPFAREFNPGSDDFMRSTTSPIVPEDAPQKWGSAALQIQKYAGSINTNRMNLTDEQKRNLMETEQAFRGPLEEALGKTLTDADVQLVAEFATSYKNVLPYNEQLKIAAQVLRLRQEVARGAAEDRPTEQYYKDFITLQSTAKFFGRMLQKFSIKADPADGANILSGGADAVRGEVLSRVLGIETDVQRVVDHARTIDWKDSRQVVKFYRSYIKPTASELIDEFRYINMLSSPRTHVINAASNAIQIGGLAPATKAVSGMVDATISGLSKRDQQHFIREVPAYFKGMIRAVPAAARKAAQALSGELPMERFDLNNIPSAGQAAKKYMLPIAKFNQAFGSVSRALEASDVLFRTLAAGGEFAAAGERSRITKGPIDVSQMWKDAMSEAEYWVFRKGLDPENATGQGKLLSKIDQFTQRIFQFRRAPIVKWFIPFVATPMNILKQGIEFSPAGFATMVGNSDKVEAFSKALLGSSVLVGAGSFLTNHESTWGIPDTPGEKADFQASGKQPYSIKIGDTWVSYAKLGPLAYPIALAAAYKFYSESPKLADKTKAERLQKTFSGYAKFFSDQSYVQGLKALTDQLEGDERMIQSGAVNTARQLVPLQGLANWVNGLADGTVRAPDGIFDRMTSNLPGLSQNVPPRITPLGDPLTKPGIEENLFNLSPVPARKQSEDPLVQELARRKIKIGVPSRTVYGVELDAEQYQRYMIEVGKRLRTELTPLLSSPAFKKLNDEQAQDEIDSIVREARSDIRTKLFEGIKEKSLEADE